MQLQTFLAKGAKNVVAYFVPPCLKVSNAITAERRKAGQKHIKKTFNWKGALRVRKFCLLRLKRGYQDSKLVFQHSSTPEIPEKYQKKTRFPASPTFKTLLRATALASETKRIYR
jgi:hypothetical protein